MGIHGQRVPRKIDRRGVPDPPLTFYEKQLLGVLRHRAVSIYKGREFPEEETFIAISTSNAITNTEVVGGLSTTYIYILVN